MGISESIFEVLAVLVKRIRREFVDEFVTEIFVDFFLEVSGEILEGIPESMFRGIAAQTSGEIYERSFREGSEEKLDGTTTAILKKNLKQFLKKHF